MELERRPHRASGWPRSAALRLALAAFFAARTGAAEAPSLAGDWQRVNAEHFILFGEVDAARLSGLAARLEEFRLALDGAVPGLGVAARRPAYVFVFGERQTLELYRRNASAAEPPAAGYFAARLDRDFIILDSTAGASIDQRVLRGYACSLAERSVTSPPAWLAAECAAAGGSSAELARLAAADAAGGRGSAVRSAIPVSRAEALARLGDLLAQVNPTQDAAAEDLLRAALALEPSNATALLAYARLEHLRGRWDEAAARYAAALDMGGAAAATQFGWLLLDRWDAEHGRAASAEPSAPTADVLRARALFQRALRLAPDDAPALHGLGRTYLFGQANDPAAAAALTRAHQLAPSRAEVTLDLVRLEVAAGRLAAAAGWIDREFGHAAVPAEIARRAERVLALAQIDRAAQAAAEGRPEEGRAILQAALERARDTGVRGLLADNLAQFQESASKRRLAATLAAASAAVLRGDNESGWRLYEQAARAADDPQTRRNAEEMARTVRRQAAANRAAARVAKALARANEGDAAGALADIDALLRDERELPESLRVEAQRARDRLRGALQPR